MTGFELPNTVLKNAGKEYEEPKVVQALHRQAAPTAAAAAPTNFSEWSQQEIVAFLDLRGEEYDDCIDFYALAARAAECEHNTGPAARPAPPAATADLEEEDPLEAFMAGNAAAAAAEPAKPPPTATAAAACDEVDDMEEYIEAHAARRAPRGAPTATPPPVAATTAAGCASDDEEVYAAAAAAAAAANGSAADGAPRRDVEPLPPVDHAAIAYPPFKRSFYDEPPDLFVLEEEEVAAARERLAVRVTGGDAPKPIAEFDHCGFPKPLADAITAAGFTEPTAIQAQVLPVRLLVLCRKPSRRRVASSCDGAANWKRRTRGAGSTEWPRCCGTGKDGQRQDSRVPAAGSCACCGAGPRPDRRRPSGSRAGTDARAGRTDSRRGPPVRPSPVLLRPSSKHSTATFGQQRSVDAPTC